MKSYFKFLSRNKAYTFINIAGLVVSLMFIIAIPLSWYILRDWLSNFSYRIELSAWIFVATCAIALLVAILSVSLQIIKAVRTNPVESIKTE